MNGGKKIKTLVIGLDGATFDILLPWMRDGSLPVLKSLADGGVRGELRSTTHPLTAPAWISMYTGMNPGKHGVFDFQQYEKNSYSPAPVNFSMVKKKAFWDCLGERGISAGLFNMPLTYPPRPLNGFLVTGLGSPVNDEPGVYPESLLGELKEAVPGYRVEGSHELFQRSVGEFIADARDVNEKHCRAFLSLLESRDCGLLMGVFTASDRFQHFLWKFMDETHPLHNRRGGKKYGGEILSYWRRMDEYIGLLMRLLPPEETDIILVSDHGFGPLHADVYINQWLHKKGWLKFREGKTRDASVFAVHFMESSTFLRRTRLDRDPAIMKLIAECFDLFQKTAPPSMADKLYNHVAPPTLLKEDQIDWPNTKAFSNGYIGRIFINAKSRFPSGTVEPEEVEALRNEIAAGLRELKTPDGSKPLVDWVKFREEVYTGDETAQAPDILFTMGGMTYITRQFSRHQTTELFGAPDIGESATHRPNGIFIANGPSFKSGVEISGADITDIAPTLLYLHDIPAPREMDGRVLASALRPELLASRPPQISEADNAVQTDGFSYSDDEKFKINHMLEGLGYL